MNARLQTVILCGGMGTRIRDVADDVPKPMIAIGDRPILWHIMRTYAAHGLTDFVLCLGYKSWTIKRWFLDYHLTAADFSFSMARPNEVVTHSGAEAEDWRVTFAETGLRVMTGCRVKRVEKYVRGDTFLLTYGDGVSDVDLTDLLRFHRQHGRLATVTAVQSPGRFGEIDIRGRQVARFQEKPSHAPGRISAGYFVFQREVFSRLTDDESLVLEHGPLSELAGAGELMAYLHDGFWHPMDNSRDYQHLNGLWASGQAPWAVRPRDGLPAAA
jgi:glucose-1-phosphate cytidylyltransferase